MNYTLKDETIVCRGLLDECPPPLTTPLSPTDPLAPISLALDSMKVRINSVKSSLNDISLKEWSTHTSLTDRSSAVIDAIRRQLSRKPFLLTKAWLKIYEILGHYRLIETLLGGVPTADPSGDNRHQHQAFHVLLLCECPGSFVNAINHYCKSRAIDVSLQWMANTLNPYYEDIDYTIIDDLFIRQTNCYDNWFFGRTNTGDVLDKDFVDDLRREMRSRRVHKYHLITADGSVNCVDCPAAQEEVVHPLIAKEILIALDVLAENGCFVVKFFTLFESKTLSLVYLLWRAFHRIHAFKPTASKAGNSEIYLVCIGFNASPELATISARIVANCGSDGSDGQHCISRSLLASQPFIGKVEECVQYFIDNQISVIESNLKTFKTMSDQQRQQLMARNRKFAKSFIKNYNIFSVKASDELVFNSDYKYNYNNCLTFRRLNDLLNNSQSYSHRKRNDFYTNVWFHELSTLLIQISDKLKYKNQLIDCKYWKQSAKPMHEFDVKFVYGLPYNQILNSKFCDLSAIIAYNKCLNNKEKFASNVKTFVSFSSDTKEMLQKLVSSIESTELFAKIISICDKNSDNFVTQLAYLLTNGQNVEIINDLNEMPSKGAQKSRNIYILNALKTFSFELISEKSVVVELIAQYIQLNAFIGENDLLVIQIGFSLTRLMCATLHTIANTYEYYSVVPSIGSMDGTECRHGLVCLFHTKRHEVRKQTTGAYRESEEMFAHVLSQLNGGEDTDGTGRASSGSLVEIISVPLLMSDFMFYETLYNANTIQMIEVLKYMSNIIIANE